MLAAGHYSDISACGALPRTELLEVHRSKISVHRAKAAYRYPTIRCPTRSSKLAGLPTRIYQTVHDGRFAFLVVVSPRPDMGKQARIDPRLHTAEVAGSNPAEPIVLFTIRYIRALHLGFLTCEDA